MEEARWASCTLSLCPSSKPLSLETLPREYAFLFHTVLSVLTEEKARPHPIHHSTILYNSAVLRGRTGLQYEACQAVHKTLSKLKHSFIHIITKKKQGTLPSLIPRRERGQPTIIRYSPSMFITALSSSSSLLGGLARSFSLNSLRWRVFINIGRVA